MKNTLKQIIVSTIILQALFGFVLPAQGQTGADTADPGFITTTTGDPTQTDTGPDPATIERESERLRQQAAREAGKNNIPEDYCSWTLFVGFEISRCIGLTLMYVGNRILWVGGTFLNSTIDITVIRMSTIVNEVGVITAGWKTFRDLANMFFIFILIYIAIATIVGATSGQTRKMLVQVIIVALLINFSMFFTKVVIDASNILSIQFYNSITKGDNTFDNGLSWTFMNASRLTSIFPAGNTVVDDTKVFTGNNMIIVGFLSLIFAIILAFCFLAIGVLFVIRFVTLLFLMMLSPLALLGIVVGGLREIWDKWKKSLTREVIFAPTIMAMLWIVASIMNNEKFIMALGLNRPGLGGDEMTFAKALTTNGSAVLVIVNFGILIAMLIGALIISKSFSGSAGGAVLGAAEKWSRKVAGGMTFGAAGFAGRQTIGRMASGLSNINALKTNRIGLAVQKSLKGVASSSFDARAAPLVGAGLQGAGLGTGVEGGFVEERQKFRTLRDKVFQRDEESVEVLRGNKRKLEIEKDVKDMRAGAGAVAGTPLALAAETAKERLKQNLSKLSEEEQVQMMSTATQWFKNVDDQKEIIETLSPAAIKAIKKKAGLTPQEKEKLTKLREQKLRNDLETIKTKTAGSSDYEESLKNLRKTSSEELEIISDDIFEIQEFVENLSRKQSKSLLENKEIGVLNKDKFKKARKEKVEKSIRLGVPGDAKRVLENMIGEEVSRLDWSTILTDPHAYYVWDNIESKQLTDAADNMIQKDIDNVREAIRVRATSGSVSRDAKIIKTNDYLQSRTGRHLF